MSTFEEQFPNLKHFVREGGLTYSPVKEDVFLPTDIQKYCIDKQRVREAIRKCEDTQKNRGEKDLIKFLEEFEKELGL